MTKILIVEDERINAMSLEQMLKKMGYDVCGICMSGEEAIDCAEKNKPDIILMDIKLSSKMSGIDAARIIQEKHDVPIIYLTAYNDSDTVKRAIETNPYGYLSKPLEERHLYSSIELGLYKHSINITLNNNHEKTKRTVRDIIEAMSTVSEIRDPYTAGHQKRVSKLSVEIAKKLKLDEDRIKCLCFAAYIHDIGKIRVPSDILMKPGELIKPEMDLIKEHPKAGYNILKKIEFPWPLAEIVYQHHEHIDGSGYPRGLMGDKIYLESMILSVADAAEAMVSHRPYRESIGLKAAISEIYNYSGIWYDKKIADTCISILKSGYNFEV